MEEKITLPKPDWNSNLADTIVSLEILKRGKEFNSIPLHIFMEIKCIFQMLETLGSSRIEGNNTTILEYSDNIIEGNKNNSPNMKEISNIQDAISFVENNIDCHTEIKKFHIMEIHKIITKDLLSYGNGEGSLMPGCLRSKDVHINKSNHTPPPHFKLNDYFDDYISFINGSYPDKDKLLMMAVAHHRFEYMHPFDNGNGRTGRVIDYALLIKLGFKVKDARIVNPSAVFYGDRERYYKMLSKADSLKQEDVLEWCDYFLSGLKNEISKIDKVLDINYLRGILSEVLDDAENTGYINVLEKKILNLLIDNNNEMTLKSQDLSKVQITSSRKKSYCIGKLKDKSILISLPNKSRIYRLQIINNRLLKSLIKVLDKNGFISKSLN